MKSIEKLVEVMAALRDPVRGCPWDIEQDFASIAPYTIEEAYEVAEAIATGNPEALREELGDLLLQVVFHARMAEEAGSGPAAYGIARTSAPVSAAACAMALPSMAPTTKSTRSERLRTSVSR